MQYIDCKPHCFEFVVYCLQTIAWHLEHALHKRNTFCKECSNDRWSKSFSWNSGKICISQTLVQELILTVDNALHVSRYATITCGSAWEVRELLWQMQVFIPESSKWKASQCANNEWRIWKDGRWILRTIEQSDHSNWSIFWIEFGVAYQKCYKCGVFMFRLHCIK